MRKIEEVSGDGFTTTKLDESLGLTLSAAHLALHSYCSTTHALRGRLHVVEPGSNEKQQEIHDYNLGWNYHRLAYQSIVHFQHFAELVIKQALRDDHELLVVVTGRNHDHLHRLLHGDPVDPNEAQSINTVEFSEALERCCTLLKGGRLKVAGYDYILRAKPFLAALNTLRNRLWHRGTYVLRYRALDELIGGYGFAFLASTMKHARFAGNERTWKHQSLACGLQPIDMIAAEMISVAPSFKKVAFLKELARAAYENPLINIDGWFDEEDDATRERARSAAKIPDDVVHNVVECPVCGVLSHVVYRSWLEDADDRPIEFTYKSRCFCCGLELYSDYGNPSEHGLTGLDDLWEVV